MNALLIMADQHDIKTQSDVDPKQDPVLAETSSADEKKPSVDKKFDVHNIHDGVVSDAELRGYDAEQDVEEAEEEKDSKVRRFWRAAVGPNKIFLHALIGVVFTG